MHISEFKANPVYIEFQEPVSKILITTPKGHTVGWERKEKWIWEELVNQIKTHSTQFSKTKSNI